MTDTGVLTYSANNSGGSWWLTDDNWTAMEAAGWDVEWVKNRKYLGALARKATIATNDPDLEIGRWESVTGQDSTDEGCNCCGEPHEFIFTDKDGNIQYSEVVVVDTRRVWS